MRYSHLFLLCLLPLLLWMVLSRIFLPQIEKAWVYGDAVSNEWGIDLPYREPQRPSHELRDSQTQREMQVGVGVYYYPFQSSYFHVSGEGCILAISINGVALRNIDRIPPAQRCGVRNGFGIDLGRRLEEGRNIIDVVVAGRTGDRLWFNIAPTLLPINYQLLLVLQSFLVVLALFPPVLQWLRFDRPTMALLFTALLCGLMQYHFSTFRVFGVDSMGHLEYVWYVANNWKVPPPHKAWQYYQQPLYYFIAAALAHLGRWLGIIPLEPVRYLSILLMILFQIFGLLTIRRLIETPWIRWLSSMAFLFWPLNMPLYGRIINELMLYVFWSASLYFLLRWHQEGRRYNIAMALGISGASLLVKTSGIVPLACVGLLLLYRLCRRRTLLMRLLRHGGFITACVISVIALGLNFSRTLYYKMTQAPELGVIIGNVYKDPFLYWLQTDNAWWKFLVFKPDLFLNYPYWQFADDSLGRQYFWNSYLKSLLYGDFRMGSPGLAIVVNYAWLGLFIFLIFAAWRNRDRFSEWALPGIAIGLIIAAQIINRMLVQTVVTHDGRFTYPIIILITALAGRHLEIFQRNGRNISFSIGLFLLSFFAVACFQFIVLEWMNML